MSEPIPAGFMSGTFWHLNHGPCEKTNDPSPLNLAVPDPASPLWAGVQIGPTTCGLCGQQLTQS